MSGMTGRHCKDAIVLYANYAGFAPGQRVHNLKVQSRMLLWCESGLGEVSVNGARRPFASGDFVFLPWNHRIDYKADGQEPFLVAGIHLVPVLRKGSKVDYRIFHNDMGRLPEYLEREDAAFPGLPRNEVFAGSFAGHRPLESLAKYIVEWFQAEPREESMARSLAGALLYELARARRSPLSNSSSQPLELKRALFFIEMNLEERLEIGQLAKLASVSRSSLFRLFRRHLGESPAAWILKRKMERAAAMLARSSLRIGELGAKLSIEDPYYFSRAFKKAHGVSPREYRRRHALLP